MPAASPSPKKSRCAKPATTSIAQRAGADQAADDDHREDQDDALVRGEQERPRATGSSHLPEQLAGGRAGGGGRLEDGRRHGADADLDQPDDRRHGEDEGGDDGREARWR